MIDGVAGAGPTNCSYTVDGANTIQGELVTKWVSNAAMAVLLKNTPIVSGDDEHQYFTVESAYPSDRPARLILLSFDTGNNYCRILHKVLEFKDDGSKRISADFGNCLEFPSPLGDERYYKAHGSPNNPHYANGEWRIGLPAEDAGRRLEWYVYSGGEVTQQRKPDLRQ